MVADSCWSGRLVFRFFTSGLIVRFRQAAAADRRVRITIFVFPLSLILPRFLQCHSEKHLLSLSSLSLFWCDILLPWLGNHKLCFLVFLHPLSFLAEKREGNAGSKFLGDMGLKLNTRRVSCTVCVLCFEHCWVGMSFPLCPTRALFFCIVFTGGRGRLYGMPGAPVVSVSREKVHCKTLRRVGWRRGRAVTMGGHVNWHLCVCVH